eukprot:6190686-Pleurochrysis_carterae.AAC.4
MVCRPAEPSPPTKHSLAPVRPIRKQTRLDLIVQACASLQKQPRRRTSALTDERTNPQEQMSAPAFSPRTFSYAHADKDIQVDAKEDRRIQATDQAHLRSTK